MHASKTEEELRDQMISGIFGFELKKQCAFALIAMDEVTACLQGMENLHKSMPSPPTKSMPSPSTSRPDAGDFAKYMEDHRKEMQKHREDMEKYTQSLGLLTNRLWYSLQNFLVAVANVSKLLWNGEARGEKLRKLYGVEESSPLKGKRFRNHFEHFDERIDDWVASSKRMCFVDSNIGPKGSIVGPDKTDYFRNFDPAKCTLSYAGEDYELTPVHEAIKSLYEKVTKTPNL